MSRRTCQISQGLLSFSLLLGVGIVAGCGDTVVVETGPTLNGTCTNCHRGISAAHPNGAAIGCVSCHGGDATAKPFLLAGVENLLETFDPEAEDLFNEVGGTFVPINPTELADQNQAPFNNGPTDLDGNTVGRYDPVFQVLLASAHNLPKGCAGPLEIVDVDNDGINPVHFKNLTPQQQQNVDAAEDGAVNGIFDANGDGGITNNDCHAVYFWPNGVNDDGDVIPAGGNAGKPSVDELGEFAMPNPADPMGLQFELAALDVNQNGVIDANEAQNVGLAQSKTMAINLRTLNGQPVQTPIKIGQLIDSEFNIDVNYVRFMNPGDVRSANASCGRKSRAAQFAGNCHDLETDVVRRSIMSYMSGVLAGAIYANGAIPNSRNLTDANGFTDRNTQDLRDGRIAYLQNYDSLDQAFDTDANRFVLEANEAGGATKGLRNIFEESAENQIRLINIFNTNFALDVNSDDQGGALNTSGLEQDDCLDQNVFAANAADIFTGNTCAESYPEELFRVDATVIARFEAEGFNEDDALEATTVGGTKTAGHGKDLAPNRRTSNRLVFDQFPLQDPQRSLFVLAPIPRRTLTGINGVLLANADAVAGLVAGQGIVAALSLPAAPENQIVGGVLDDRQFSRLAGINPVDTALQTFRPFHSLSFPNINGDFNFFDERNLLDNNNANDVFVLRNNPHGRGRGSGCTSCHMPYAQDGVSRESTDPTVRNNGKQPGDVFLGKSPLVNFGNAPRSVFNAANNAAAENAAAQALFLFDVAPTALGGAQNEKEENDLLRAKVAQALNLDDINKIPRLQPPFGSDDFGRERFYPAIHKLTTQINSRDCEVCHAFVTRVGFAAVGRHENEGGMDFINWYTWTPRDVQLNNGQNDGRITHRFVVNDAAGNVNDPVVADGTGSDLGRFINNRAAAPEEDFLEFRNGLDPNQLVRIFNNLQAFDGTNNVNVIVNTGDRFTEDLNNNGLLDLGENRADLDNGAALDLPDRPSRTVIFDGRAQRAVYGGASGAVLLQDIHLEKGMHCIDCHQLYTVHGDGNLYARNWDVVSDKCAQCHGDSKKPGPLRLLGPNGGQDMTKSKDQFGVPFFEIGRNGERIQRSHVVPGRQWRIPQVIDAIDPKSDQFSPEAAEAMAVLDQNGLNAHIPDNVEDENGILRVGIRKIECSTCHSSWTPNCMTCHMDFDYAQTVGEIWATQQRNPISFFQLFTIIRAPFVLAFAGSNERNRIMTIRSLMELHPNVTLNTGDALTENFTFTSARGVSGVAMNQYMAHTVRLRETKDCESCHTMVGPNDDFDVLQGLIDDGLSPFDNILNNNILSQTLGLGSGTLGEPGDYFFAASAVGLEGIDIKAESRRAVDNDGDGAFVNTAQAVRNTFQGFRGLGFGSGFLVSSGADQAVIDAGLFEFGNGAGRSFTNAIAGGLADVVFIRNFVDPTEQDPNSTQFIGAVRAMDLIVGAENNGLTVRVVIDRLGLVSNARQEDVAVAADIFNGNITAIDHIAPDMSSQFIYAVTDQGEFGVIDLRKLILGQGLFTGFARAGFNGQALAAQTNLGGSLTDVEIEGNFAFVLNNNNGNGEMQIVFARQLRRIDRVVNQDAEQQVAGDFLLDTPGDLTVVNQGNEDLGGCTDPRRIAIMNIMAYIACGADGLVVVNIEDPKNPRVIAEVQDSAVFDFDGNGNGDGQSVLNAGGLDDAQGVFAADNRLFVANGSAVNANNAGVVVFDVTSPKNPIPVHTYTKANGVAATDMFDPVDIVGFVEPGEQWILVSDSGDANGVANGGRAHAINVTEPYNIRVRLGEHAAAAKGVLANQDDEANFSVPGFRPVDQLEIFRSQSNMLGPGRVAAGNAAGVAAPRPFFEFTNIRFSIALRDPLTPNDPANIDDLILNQPLIITFPLGGAGDIRIGQTHELDRIADWSGFEERDSWAAAVKLNTDCTTDIDGDIVGINEQDPTDDSCTSEAVNDGEFAGKLGARVLSGPAFKIVNGQLNLVRGEMDIMRSVFVREVNGVDVDGNGLGNLECVAVGTRGDGFTLDGLIDCKELYPKDVADELFKAKTARNNKTLTKDGKAQARN